MSLEQTVMEISNFFVNTPVRATFDIGGHCLAGAFLVQRYFPEAPKSMKALLGLTAGFAPDFDYFTLGAIAHHKYTHTGGFALGLTSWMLYFNKEDWYRFHDGKTILQNAVNDVKRVFTSRYAKLASLGVALHLAMDSLATNAEQFTYCAVVGTALVLQNIVNRKNNRYEKKETFRMHPCIVVDQEGRKYFVSEEYHSRYSQEFIDDERQCRDNFGMPLLDIPVYAIPEYQFGNTDVVRDYQKTATRDIKTFFERVDEWTGRFFGFRTVA